MRQLRILFSALLLALNVYQSDGRAQMVINSYSFAGPQSYALDQISTANLAGAWSNRKLLAAYSGYANEVRRSSDNATLNIDFVGEHYNTAAMTGHVSSNSGYVKTWYDQSGNGRNLIQATNANQPRIVNAGTAEALNSKTAVTGTGSSTLVADMGSRSTTALTLLIVFRKTNNVVNNRTLSTWNTGTGNDYGSTGAFAIENHTTTDNCVVIRNFQTTNPVFGNNTVQMLLVRFDNTNLRTALANASVLSTSSSGTFDFNRLSLFAATGSGDYSLNSIAELIVYERYLSDSECNTLRTNVGSYYGLSVTNL